MTTRIAGGLDFSANGGKRHAVRSAPIVENNAVKPGAKHPVWNTRFFKPSPHRSSGSIIPLTCLDENLLRSCLFNLCKLQAKNTIV